MVCWCRLLLLWLMAVTIPLQGIAAATAMAHCAPAPQRAGSVEGDAMHSGGHTRHDHPVQVEGGSALDAQPHAQPEAHAHADVDAVAAGAADHGPERGADSAGHTGHSTLKCCSAVCALAMPVAQQLAVRSPVRAPAPTWPAALFAQGVVLDGLERPPRQALI